jgi:hypothetical protein
VSLSNTLLSALREYPDEPALRAMTIDALIEEEIYAPEAAVLHVDETILNILNARRLAQATHLMRPDQDSSAYLRASIRRLMHERPSPGTLMVVVAGDAEPNWSRPRFAGRGSARVYHSITVGANWICRIWDEHLAQREAVQRAMEVVSRVL